MRFVVFGAGAVGGVVGGRLAEHGHDVVLIARGAHYDAIRRKGLVVESPDATVRLDIPVVDRPAAVSWSGADVVLMAMKTQDAKAALDDLVLAAPPQTPLVSLQNGVANEALFLRCFPGVYGICVMCPTSHLTPGVVQAWSSPVAGLLDIGRYPAGVDDTAAKVAAALGESGFQSEARADIMRWKYGKLLMNLANAIEALCGPSARQSLVADAAKREALDCFAAAGIAHVGDEEDRARRKDYLTLRPIGDERRSGGSSWQSLRRHAGTIEADYLNGEIVLLGRQHGIATPANALLQRLAREAAARRDPPGRLPVEELERRLSQV